MSKFSPPPWRTDESGAIVDARGDEVAVVIGEHNAVDADRRLIVAAPKLYDLLQSDPWKTLDWWSRRAALLARIDGDSDE
jgi:hypothetical protein